MTSKHLCSFIVLLTMAHHPCRGQEHFAYNTQAEQTFQRGVLLFHENSFLKAFQTFDSVANQQPMHQRTTAAFVMGAKARFSLGAYLESARLLVDFLKKIPETSYADDARFTLALDYMMLQWYDEAAFQLLRGAELSADTGLVSKSLTLFESIADHRLDAKILQNIVPKIRSTNVKDLLSLKLAEKYYAAGDSRRAKEVIQEIPYRSARGPYFSRIRRLNDQLGKIISLKIGVILPLMKTEIGSPLQTISQELLDGIQYALREVKQNSVNFASISLEVRDTGRDSVLAAQVMNELALDDRVVSIIGPLFSNLAFVCAPIANRAGVSMVSPTAAGNGIAGVGQYVFQVSPDYVTRGKAMAQYAVQRLGFTSLAVLGSAEPMGKSLAESFETEAKRLGATIVASELYPKGVSDMREQFIKIRTAALSLASQQDKPDDLDVPIQNIQGIFIPISGNEELGIIAAQMKYFNINTQLFGSSEWNDPGQLDEHKRYVNGAIFLGDVFVDEDDSLSNRFEQSYRAEMKIRPSKYTLFGYDTMKLILDQIGAGAITRTSLASALSNVEAYQAIHSKITFRYSRVNSELMILKYVNGEILKLADVAVK